MGVYSMEMQASVHIKTCMYVFIADLFIIAPNWKKKTKCPSTHPYCGILFSNKKEWTIDILNLHESQTISNDKKSQKVGYYMIPLCNPLETTKL